MAGHWVSFLLAILARVLAKFAKKVEVNIRRKKKGGYSGYLNSTSLFNKGFIIWPLLLLLYITRTLGKAVLESALLQWNPAITDRFVCPAWRKAYQDTFYAASHMFSYFIDPSTGTLDICALFIAGLTCYKSTSWRAERALFGWNPTKDFWKV